MEESQPYKASLRRRGDNVALFLFHVGFPARCQALREEKKTPNVHREEALCAVCVDLAWVVGREQEEEEGIRGTRQC